MAIEDIISSAEEIRDETATGANTANRIGTVLLDIANMLSSFNTQLATISASVFPGIENRVITEDVILQEIDKFISFDCQDVEDLLLTLENSDDCPGRVHTVYNNGNQSVWYSAGGSDKINGSLSRYEIGSKKCATIMSFDDKGWLVISEIK